MANFRPPFLLNPHPPPSRMFSFFRSEFFDFELTRLLGTAPFGGCDIAEFLEAVGNIKREDPESWYRAWLTQAERAEEIARQAAGAGHVVSARRAHLRASNYFRASPYMLPGSDERVLPNAQRAVQNFRQAIPLMEARVLVLEIPYEGGVSLPGYLFIPAASTRVPARKIPVVLNCGGADSTQEELYFMYGVSGVELGYAVLTFEGPGQGRVLKRDKVPMRPDYEVVTRKVLDHLAEIDSKNPDLGLDLDRIAVAGVSMGAYYALRTATDPRIKACVAVDPFYSLWALALTRMPQWYAHLWQTGWIPEAVFNWSIRTHMRVDFPSRWEFSLGSHMMGMTTPGDTLRRFQDFSLDISEEGKVLERVQCPVLVTGAGRTIYASAESSTVKIYNLLTRVPESRKDVWIPEEAGEGGLTGKVGAWGLLSQRAFQFLDKHFKVERGSLSKRP